MKPTLLPYLAFKGQAREAMTFYQSVLGGDLTISTMGESGMPVAEDEKNNVMHAELKNGALTFMASDGTKEHSVTVGNSISMSLIGTDEELLTKYFNGLSEGGKIDEPLVKAPWGDMFGMFTDKFGIHWMVNISAAAPKN